MTLNGLNIRHIFLQERNIHSSGVKVDIVGQHEEKAREKGQIVAYNAWVVIPADMA